MAEKNDGPQEPKDSDGEQGPQGAATEEVQATEDQESAKRGGDKELAQNSDAMAVEQGSEEPEPEKVAKPSFFVDRSKNHRIEVDILTRKTDGQVVSVARADIGMNYEQFDKLHHSSIWFDFTMPDYDQMAKYRQTSAVYRREAAQMMVDKIQLRNYLLVWHLKDWSLTGDDGEKLELEHDTDGDLKDASIERVYAMHTTILDVVLTVLEKELLIT